MSKAKKDLNGDSKVRRRIIQGADCPTCPSVAGVRCIELNPKNFQQIPVGSPREAVHIARLQLVQGKKQKKAHKNQEIQKTVSPKKPVRSIPEPVCLQPHQYARYMKSQAWQRKRDEFKASEYDTGECWSCGRPWGFGGHLHHRTYDRLGIELLTDLVPLCDECHEMIHDVPGCMQDLWNITNETINMNRSLLGLDPCEWTWH